MSLFMADPLEAAKKADEPMYQDPRKRRGHGRARSIQGTIPILAVSEDGVFRIAAEKYSRTYELSDVNFAALTDREKKPIMERWGAILKGLRCTDLKVTVLTRYIDEEKAQSGVLYKPRQDGLGAYRDAYNEAIGNAIYHLNQGLEQHIYLTATEDAPTLRDARAAFQELEVPLRYALAALDTGSGVPFHFDVREACRTGREFVNEIVSAELTEERTGFHTEWMYGCAYYIRSFPNSCDDGLIPALAGHPCPSLVTVDIKPVDGEAVRARLKACYMSVQQRINRSQEEKARHGNFTDVARVFATETSEIEELLDSADGKDERYFLVDVYVVQLAPTREELRSLSHSLDAMCRSKSVSIRPVLLHQLDAVATALPIGTRYWEHSRCNNTESTACLLPFA